MKQNFIAFLDKLDFDSAIKYSTQLKKEVLREYLLEYCFKTESIVGYTFVCALLNVDESSENHYLASELMTSALCHLTGAYQVGLYHARKALEISPEDISLKEYLLLFYDIPERLIHEEEAKKLALDIIKENPNSRAAQNILSKI